jgi:hypothetical protein
MRISPDDSKALAAFVARKTEIDTILARLSALSAEHFHRAPKNVTWADVGTLGCYPDGLRKVSDLAFHEGEHAVGPPRPGCARRGLGWYRAAG